MLVHDFDSDGDLDILGEGFGWAQNDGSGSFSLLNNIIGDGGFVQGSGAGRFRIGGPIEVIYTYKNGDGIRKLIVPAEPASSQWPDAFIYDWEGKSKNINIGDIDHDGDDDVMFVGRDGATIQWLQNAGNGSFKPINLADSPSKINHRCHLGDINGDGRLDVVIGHKGRLATWYEQGDSSTAIWKKHIIADSSILNFDPLSIDLADMDRDRDLDVIIGEHTPDVSQREQCVLYIFENANDSGTEWIPHPIHKGDEHHQGSQAVDIDGDGDLDIVSVGWKHPLVLLYENKAIDGRN